MLQGDHPTITTCYMTSIEMNPSNSNQVNCERFDTDLGSIFSTNLPLLKKHDPVSVSLAIDSSGNSFISVVELGETHVFRLYKLNPTGGIINIIKLAEIPKQKYWGGFQVRGFFVSNQYCFETTKIWSMWVYPSDADENESIKCIVT